MSIVSCLVCLCVLLQFPRHVLSEDKLGVRDPNHMKKHLQGTIDFRNLTQRELLFHYFQVHDFEGNNKLDGLELLQSVLHMYSEATIKQGATMRIFSDAYLAKMVDAVLERDDKNMDGFIDYSEFLAGEISRAF